MTLAIVGRNAAGKSLLVDKIMKRYGQKYNIRYVTFRDSYGDADATYFLQLRWNQAEIDKETPTTGELLEKAFRLAGNDTPERRALQSRLYDMFGLRPLLDKYIISLSSGELRKFQLTKAMMSNPKVLILDNPFIGLDAETRQQLKEILRHLPVIMVVSRRSDIPDYVENIIEVEDGKLNFRSPITDNRISTVEKQEQKAGNQEPEADNPPLLSPEKHSWIINLPYSDTLYNAREVVKMNRVSIRYGDRTILKDLSLTINNGERWALSGRNGSGKSTLLSLICADNPQGYACDIELFGRKRGSGESIWEIKRHIGYVSPEMHRSYNRDISALRIVASGMKDTIGLYVKPTEEELEQCRRWMWIFGIDSLADTSFLKLSSGEQRLVLLARAFVKDPELLILDEPLHGLDDQNRQLAKEIIEAFCQRKNKTLLMVTHYRDEWPQNITHSLSLARTN